MTDTKPKKPRRRKPLFAKKYIAKLEDFAPENRAEMARLMGRGKRK